MQIKSELLGMKKSIEHLKLLLESTLPDLNSESFNTLESAFAPKQFDANTTLLHQGSRWSNAYLIESGHIRMYFLNKDGKAFNKNFFGPGALILPLTPSMQHEPSLFSISCIGVGTLWQCDMQQFEAILPEDTVKSLKYQLLTRLLDGKLQREHDLLTLSAKQRYQKLLEQRPDLAEHIPLHHLASYLGMTPVTLSRLRADLKKSP
ncbi:Crp/Fnr family transcriptional regulator [Leucothrix pacifica]|uniref:Crp/Fnr family transcriptional regulator n=2 Tax=Leucothrix pacifica TaxID=1247513 RepID=A0A317CDH0_9GAMM|nr:Crp/Fnr family transcriptional regulator [Leucothrix pacifica]